MSLTISIDRTELELEPLVLSGSIDENEIGVTNYTEPATQARIRYAPPSNIIAGDVSLAATLQQSLLQFDVVTDQASDESDSQSALDEVRTAIGQFRYAVTVTVGDALAKTWTCDTGSVGPIARDAINLRDFNPVATVALPCYPIPTIAEEP